MKKEFKSQLQDLLNSSLNARSPIQQYHHKPKTPYDDYSRPSLNNSIKSTSIFGLDYTSPLRSVTKRKDTPNNDSNDFFKDLKNQCFKFKERDSNSTTSRNTLFDKQTNNKYTYEELKQLHQITNKNDNNNNNNGGILRINDTKLNYNNNKNRFIIKNTPSAIKRKIALFADNFNLNNNNASEHKGNANTNAKSLKFDLNKNKTNTNNVNTNDYGNIYNNVQKSKYGSFLNRELDCSCNKDKKKINKWIKEIQSDTNGGNVYVRTEMNNYKGGNSSNGLGRLEFKKDSKNYKFKGDKRMEAFMKEFNIDSLELKNANRKYKNNYD